jgi:cell division protein YceG involved in septum cleavage
MSLQNKVPSINGLWLKIYLKQNPPDFGLQVGSYEVPKESNIESVIQSLKKPIIEQIKLTLLE